MTDDLIKPIQRDAVHRICSGQVVLSLAIAVKELVENSIDAGATIIDIQLKEYGSELIMVADNGKGICEDNFQALTLRHHTSKIKEFQDLETIATLGFRGEALSSLCALSDLSILTKHVDVNDATKIYYDTNGRIKEKSTAARESGTTVFIENLFQMLPVRRKEFIKNLKREFAKMCQLLHAYCLVSKGIKFTCTNSVKGGKNRVVSTEGAHTVRENVISVFGAKQISSLIEIDLVSPEADILESFGLKDSKFEEITFQFEFFISSVMHGNGQSTNSRQFYYINSRPCEPSKISKLINEVYKQYNSHQYPFVFLNLNLESRRVDVNVTPDKRQLFLRDEKLILATIKMSLLEAFKNFPSTFARQNLDLSQSIKKEESKGLKRSISSCIPSGSITERFKKRNKTEEKMECNYSPKKKEKIISDIRQHFNSNKMELLASNDTIDEKYEDKKSLNVLPEQKERSNVPDYGMSQADISLDLFLKEAVNISKQEELNGISSQETLEEKLPQDDDQSKESFDTMPSLSMNLDKDHSDEDLFCNIQPTVSDNQTDVKSESHTGHTSEDLYEGFDDDTQLVIDNVEMSQSNRKSIKLDISLGDVDKAIRNRQEKASQQKETIVKFRTKIEPESNKLAEDELRKQISKGDFGQMQILGQFNLGFIVTRLGNDLFIVDQHASDEKYNFEQLQTQTVFKSQNLVSPKLLNLTAGNEALLLEHEELFKRFGFKFIKRPAANRQEKVHLTAVPLSENMVLGETDLDEMLLMLQDSAQAVCTPSRIRSMLATKACKKSVVIGKHLSKNHMRKLIDHMGEIEHPWNCPHGRPTMRHLINLDILNCTP